MVLLEHLFCSVYGCDTQELHDMSKEHFHVLGFLTILETFGQPGLELEIDGEWRAVPPSPNLLIVNIGEQLGESSEIS